jgi:DASS family divalent anion:Na+ symporter
MASSQTKNETTSSFHMDKTQLKKNIGAMLGIILGLLIAMHDPFPGLKSNAMQVLGITTFAVTYWAFGVIQDMVTAIIMNVMFLLIVKLPFNIVLGGFSNSSLWLILAAMLFSSALNSTGLMRRFSLWMLKTFPGSYFGQLLALYLIGFVVIGPMVPSAVAKIAIPTPIALGVASSMGLEDGSRGTAGLSLGVFISSGVLGGIAFMTGIAPNIAYIGSLPPNMKEQITWSGWLSAGLPLALLIGVIMFFIVWLYFGKGVKAVPKDQVISQLADMGSITKKEKLCGCIISVTFLLWITGSFTNITAEVVGLAAVAALFIINVINNKDLSGVNWNVWLYLGLILNLGTVMTQVGIDKWLNTILGPFLLPLAGNPLMFLIALMVVITVTRMILPSQVTAGVLILVVLAPILSVVGFNPFVLLITMAAVSNHWLMPYLNVPYLAQYSLLEGRGHTHVQARILSVIYLLLCLGGIILSIPYWRWLGLM